MKKRRDYQLANIQGKLKAIRRLVKEWESQLPTHFYLIIRNILNNEN